MEHDVKQRSDDVVDVNGVSFDEQRRHHHGAMMLQSNLMSKSEHASSSAGAGARVLHQHQQLRKSNKPLMEKRRRERINNCLDQLKSILMEVSKKESSYYSKLEKADILEMTVKYLKNLKRQHLTGATPSLINNDVEIDMDEGGSADVVDNKSISKYVAGFNECATEVNHYLASLDMRRRSPPGLIEPTASPSPSPSSSAAAAVGSSSSSSFNSSATSAMTIIDSCCISEVQDSLREHLADSLTRQSTASRQSTSSPDTTTKTAVAAAAAGAVAPPIVDGMRHQSHSRISDETIRAHSAVTSTHPLQLPPRFHSSEEEGRPLTITGERHRSERATSQLSTRPFPEPFDTGNSRVRFELASSATAAAAATRLWSQPEVAMTSTSSERSSLPPLQVLPARLATGEIVFLLASGGATCSKVGQYSAMTGSHVLLSPNQIPTECETSSTTVQSLRLNVSAANNRTHRSASTTTLVVSPTNDDVTSPPPPPLDIAILSSTPTEEEQLRSAHLLAFRQKETKMEVVGDEAGRDSVVNDNGALADRANNNIIEPMWRPW